MEPLDQTRHIDMEAARDEYGTEGPDNEYCHNHQTWHEDTQTRTFGPCDHTLEQILKAAADPWVLQELFGLVMSEAFCNAYNAHSDGLASAIRCALADVRGEEKKMSIFGY